MDYDVVEARYVRDYVLWLRFRDGTSGEIDLQPELRGPIFETLKNLDTFRQFHVSPAIGTVAWPNHADIAPEFLYANVRRADAATSQPDGYAESATSSSPPPISLVSHSAPALRRPHVAGAMPEISRFHGIVIAMYYDEHGRPHFHARSGEHEVSVEIEPLVVRGEFPGASLRLVLDWAEVRRAELLANWDRARRGHALVPIAPLA